MKKLFLTIFAFSALFTLDVFGMKRSKDDALRNNIKKKLEVNVTELQSGAWPRVVQEITHLIEDVMTAKLEGRLQDVDLKTIAKLKEQRDSFQAGIDFLNERIRKQQEPKTVQTKVQGKILSRRSVLNLNMEALIKEARENPNDYTFDDINQRENYLKEQITATLNSPVEYKNLPHQVRRIEQQLKEIAYAQENGYLANISNREIQGLIERKEEIKSMQEALRAAREGK